MNNYYMSTKYNKPIPRKPAYDIHEPQYNINYSDIDILYTTILSSDYNEIINILNTTDILSYKKMNGENLIFAILQNETSTMTEDNILKIIRILAEKNVSICTFNQYNQTPLHLASIKGFTNIMKYFIDKGCNPTNIDSYGNTPVHYYVDNFVYNCENEYYDENNKTINEEQDKKNKEHIKIDELESTNINDKISLKIISKIFETNDVEKNKKIKNELTKLDTMISNNVIFEYADINDILIKNKNENKNDLSNMTVLKNIYDEIYSKYNKFLNVKYIDYDFESKFEISNFENTIKNVIDVNILDSLNIIEKHMRENIRKITSSTDDGIIKQIERLVNNLNENYYVNLLKMFNYINNYDDKNSQNKNFVGYNVNNELLYITDGSTQLTLYKNLQNKLEDENITQIEYDNKIKLLNDGLFKTDISFFLDRDIFCYYYDGEFIQYDVRDEYKYFYTYDIQIITKIINQCLANINKYIKFLGNDNYSYHIYITLIYEQCVNILFNIDILYNIILTIKMDKISEINSKIINFIGNDNEFYLKFKNNNLQHTLNINYVKNIFNEIYSLVYEMINIFFNDVTELKNKTLSLNYLNALNSKEQEIKTQFLFNKIEFNNNLPIDFGLFHEFVKNIKYKSTDETMLFFAKIYNLNLMNNVNIVYYKNDILNNEIITYKIKMDDNIEKNQIKLIESINRNIKVIDFFNTTSASSNQLNYGFYNSQNKSIETSILNVIASYHNKEKCKKYSFKHFLDESSQESIKFLTDKKINDTCDDANNNIKNLNEKYTEYYITYINKINITNDYDIKQINELHEQIVQLNTTINSLDELFEQTNTTTADAKIVNGTIIKLNIHVFDIIYKINEIYNFFTEHILENNKKNFLDDTHNIVKLIYCYLNYINGSTLDSVEKITDVKSKNITLNYIKIIRTHTIIKILIKQNIVLININNSNSENESENESNSENENENKSNSESENNNENENENENEYNKVNGIIKQIDEFKFNENIADIDKNKYVLQQYNIIFKEFINIYDENNTDKNKNNINSRNFNINYELLYEKIKNINAYINNINFVQTGGATSNNEIFNVDITKSDIIKQIENNIKYNTLNIKIDNHDLIFSTNCKFSYEPQNYKMENIPIISLYDINNFVNVIATNLLKETYSINLDSLKIDENLKIKYIHDAIIKIIGIYANKSIQNKILNIIKDFYKLNDTQKLLKITTKTVDDTFEQIKETNTITNKDSIKNYNFININNNHLTGIKIINGKCKNDNIIKNMKNLNLNYNILDINGNTVLHKFINQYNVDAVKNIVQINKLLSKFKNKQGLNCLEYINFIKNRIAKKYECNDLNLQIKDYVNNLVNSLKNNDNFSKYYIPQDVLENIMLSCILLFNNYIDNQDSYVKKQIDKLMSNNRDYTKYIADYDDVNKKYNSNNFDGDLIDIKTHLELIKQVICDIDDNKKDTNKKCVLNFILMKSEFNENVYEYLTQMNTLCNNLNDLYKYEDSSINVLNDSIINLIKTYCIQIFASFNVYEILSFIMDNYKLTEKTTSDIGIHYAKIQQYVILLLNTNFIVETNLKNDSKEYENSNITKQNIITYLFNFVLHTPENNEHVVELNKIMDFYMFVSQNISYNIKENIYNFMDDNKKLFLLFDMEKIIKEEAMKK